MMCHEKSTSIKWASLGLNAFIIHCQALKASNALFAIKGQQCIVKALKASNALLRL
jgi:hypothetical protein